VWCVLLHNTVHSTVVQYSTVLYSPCLPRACGVQMEMQCEGRVLVGDAREELQLFCEHLQPDLLVIGSHGRGPLGRRGRRSVRLLYATVE